ncbi:MAG: KamA family radical SAM protein [Eubacteriales bacterium]|nr:KamA family radical SAM protein [Eubacteriales bacterium]
MDWKNALKKNITRADELQDILHLNSAQTTQLDHILDKFPMSIPEYYLSLINWEDKDDPVRKMCIPSIEETDLSGDFDTSGEGDNTKMTGLQHKYHETALILSTHQCAMYCRHCFRKRLVGVSTEETTGNIDLMADYVRSHTEISNVLISGGDAFLNSNRIIEHYLKLFTEIDHLDFIRFGTRTPVVLPMRIYDDPELLDILETYNNKKQIYVVTQFNHPNELTEDAKRAVSALTHRGIIVRNQTVLLKGVNDNGKILGTLLKEMTRSGIVPYYIFQCRPVTGVKNQFQVPLLAGCQIVEEAKAMQNGQGKCIRYAMSHRTGKIEILGTLEDNKMLFKYHQAKNDGDKGKIFTLSLTPDQTWLEE